MTRAPCHSSNANKRLAVALFCAALLAPKFFNAPIALPLAGQRTALELLNGKPARNLPAFQTATGDASRP